MKMMTVEPAVPTLAPLPAAMIVDLARHDDDLGNGAHGSDRDVFGFAGTTTWVAGL